VVSESLTFPSPTGTLSAILIGIESLLARAFSRPEVRGKYVRSIILESNILHHCPWIRQFPFKEAVGSQSRAMFVIKNALGSVRLPGPLEDLKLTLAGLTGQSGIQSSLFPEVRKREQLRETVRQLEVQLGCPPPIFVVRDLEPWSRIPERRQVLVRFDP
jgi:DNA polymerase-4/protein ImuB